MEFDGVVLFSATETGRASILNSTGLLFESPRLNEGQNYSVVYTVEVLTTAEAAATVRPDFLLEYTSLPES